MSLSPSEAHELADLLPGDMSCRNARERLLCVLEILRRLTDRGHVLSNADIRAILVARFGEACSASENTVAADLRALQTSGCLDLVLHTTPSGSWVERARLTPSNVRLLLNAVQSSRALSVEQSYELQESLLDLVSRHQEDDLASEILVSSLMRRDQLQVLETIDTVARAMRRGRRIDFAYTYTGFDGKPHVLASDDGKLLRCETPTALYYSEGNYYVETYSSHPWRHSELQRCRADRMTNVAVSETAAENDRAAYDARRSARKRLEREFSMIEGPNRLLFLRVRSDCTNVFYDRFGLGARFAQYEGQNGDVDQTALTLVSIAQAFSFYRWLSSAGNGIVLAEPPEEIGLRLSPWKRQLKDVSRERLVQDYQSVRQGFLAYLDQARAPYAGSAPQD